MATEEDTGWLWLHGPGGGQVSALVMDPHDPAVVYAGTQNGLVFKTSDGGHTWSGTLTRLTGSGVRALAIDPTAPEVVYVGGELGLFKSSDGGSSFGGKSLVDEFVLALAVDPRGAVYAGCKDVAFVLHSTDGGSSWKRQPLTGSKTTSTNALVIDPLDPETVYAATDRGVQKTTDAGERWVATGLRIRGREQDGVTTLAIDPLVAGSVYAGTLQGEVYRTRNGGKTWKPRGADLYIVCAIAVDPRKAGVVYACTEDGLFRSKDEGKKWKRLGGFDWASTLAVSSDRHPMICVGGSGVKMSLDGGTSWERFGVPDEVRPVAIDADGAVYAEAGGYLFRASKGERSWRTIDVAGVSAIDVAVHPEHPHNVFVGGSGGIAKSVDAGESWSMLTGDDQQVARLVIDAGNPETMYAGSEDGVLTSVDGGRTWRATAFSESVTSLSVDATGVTMYVCAERGIFSTEDGGGTWRELPQPKGRVVSAVLVDPRRPHVVYGATSVDWASLGDGNFDMDAHREGIARGFGVVRSEDGGTSWRAAERGLVLGTDDGSTFQSAVLAVDPRRAETLYAATIAGVFRSTDGGASWDNFSQGLANTRPLGSSWDSWSWLEIDRDGRTLYAGLDGGSVYARALGD